MVMGRIFSARKNINFFSPARTRPDPKNAQVYSTAGSKAATWETNTVGLVTIEKMVHVAGYN
jgi:hypothetical protein